jgi:hypothetical protein
MRDSRSTQRGKILDALISARGGWVPLPQITACAAQYNARIFELRRMGHVIRNRTREIDGVRHSWFRLESGASQPIPASAATTPAENLPLFGEGGR